jgi:hypothetical protein
VYKADAEIRKIGELGLQEPLKPWTSIIKTDIAGLVVCYVERFLNFIVLCLATKRNMIAIGLCTLYC